MKFGFIKIIHHKNEFAHEAVESHSSETHTHVRTGKYQHSVLINCSHYWLTLPVPIPQCSSSCMLSLLDDIHSCNYFETSTVVGAKNATTTLLFPAQRYIYVIV